MRGPFFIFKCLAVPKRSRAMASLPYSSGRWQKTCAHSRLPCRASFKTPHPLGGALLFHVSGCDLLSHETRKCYSGWPERNGSMPLSTNKNRDVTKTSCQQLLQLQHPQVECAIFHRAREWVTPRQAERSRNMRFAPPLRK